MINLIKKAEKENIYELHKFLFQKIKEEVLRAIKSNTNNQTLYTN